MTKSYAKKPNRQFRLKNDLVVPAGTVFAGAAIERGGDDRMEAVVGLGTDASAWLNLPLRVVEIDAQDWFEEVTDDAAVGGEPREADDER